MKKKKELQERLAALKTEHRKQLDALMASETPLSGDHKVTYDARQAEIDTAQEELDGIERLEAAAKANPNPRGTVSGERIEGGEDLAAKKPFASFGEQLQAIAFAYQGKPIDVRLAASGGSVAVPSDGGFLVQEDFSTALLAKSNEVGMVAPDCRKIPISGNANGLKAPYIDETSRATGSRFGGVQIYRANEADTVTAKKPKLGKLEMSLEKLMGIAYMTDELLADAAALEAIYGTAFAEEFAYTVDDEVINGDGAGRMLGILNADCLVTVSKESGQAADTILYENIVKMFSRMPARLARSAKWYINQDVIPQLALMKITDSNLSWPVFLPPGGASVAPYGTLMGRPIVPIEQASTIGDVGDIIFANFGEYGIIEKGGLNAASSMHVRFLNDEMTFRWTMRNNGQPLWKTAKTPAKGSATLSPFVVLEAR